MRKNIRRETPPEGFRYHANILPLEEEQELVKHIRELPLKEFEFQGYFGKRRTLSDGWHYGFGTEKPRQNDGIPPFLHRLRGDWEHSIPAVDALRYSITFRSLWPRR